MKENADQSPMSESEKLVVRRYLDQHAHDRLVAFEAWKSNENLYAGGRAAVITALAALPSLLLFDATATVLVLAVAFFFLNYSPITAAREAHMLALFNKA